MPARAPYRSAMEFMSGSPDRVSSCAALLRIALLGLALAFVLGCADAAAFVQGEGSSAHRVAGGVFTDPDRAIAHPDRLLVRFRGGVSKTEEAEVRQSVGVKPMRSYHLVPRLKLLTVASDESVPEAVAALSRNPDVEYATPDVAYHVQATPDDPLYGDQWGPERIGAPAAWDRATGSPEHRRCRARHGHRTEPSRPGREHLDELGRDRGQRHRRRQQRIRRRPARVELRLQHRRSVRRLRARDPRCRDDRRTRQQRRRRDRCELVGEPDAAEDLRR